jgi:hypothetical protein
MTHKRTSIRNTWKTLLESALGSIQTEEGRTHAVSSFPLVNVKSGSDDGIVEENNNSSRPRRYTVKTEINVASNEHDVQIDDILEIIDQVIENNPKNAFWSALYFEQAEEPEEVAGKTDYSKCVVSITFMYEV